MVGLNPAEIKNLASISFLWLTTEAGADPGYFKRGWLLPWGCRIKKACSENEVNRKLLHQNILAYLTRAFAIVFTFFSNFFCFASQKGGWLSTQPTPPPKSAQEREITGLFLCFEKGIQPKLYLEHSILAICIAIFIQYLGVHVFPWR